MYVTPTSNKSRGTALVLAVTLGWLGAHQFYVGRIGEGIIYALTLGLFGIGWLKDIWSILLGTYTDNVGAPLRR
jgi:restriction system protein